VLPGLLHVQDLPPQREDGLEFPVPSLLGAPACRISFHDIDLALFRVTLGAVCQLAGQACTLKCALPPGKLTGVPCSLPCFCRRQRLLHDGLEHLGVLIEIFGECGINEGVGDPFHIAVPQPHLGLPLKLRARHLDRDDRGQAFPDILAPQRDRGVLLDQAVPLCNDVDGTGDGAPESLKVGPALPGIDGVDVAEDLLIVSRGILHRHLELDFILLVLPADVDRGGVDAFRPLVQVPHEFRQAPGITVADMIPGPLIGDDDGEARIQEGELPEPVGEEIVIELGRLKDRLVRDEGNPGTRHPRSAAGEELPPQVTLLVAGNRLVGREGCHFTIPGLVPGEQLGPGLLALRGGREDLPLGKPHLVDVSLAVHPGLKPA